MARTLELDTITEPGNSGTANITLSSNTTTTMPLVDINGGAIDGTSLGVASPSSVAATTISASGATTLNGATTMNGDVTIGNASSDTVTLTGTMAGANNQSGLSGEIRMWGGSSAPTAWVLCDGSAISRTTYSVLFGIIGTAFGIGDGSSTFNVPDMRGRMPVGVGTGVGGAAEDADGGTVPSGGSAITARSLGEWTGAEVLSSAQLAAHTHTGAAHTHTGAAHTHTGASHTHTGPSHTHTGPSHQHQIYVQGGTNVNTVSGAGDGFGGAGGAMHNYNTVGHMSGAAGTGATGAAGTGATGATTPGTGGSTTPGAGGSTTPGAGGSTGSASKFTTPIMCVNFIIKL